MPEPTDRSPDVVCVGTQHAWVLRTPDGRRCSEPLSDATARHYCRKLGISFPPDGADKSATRWPS